MKVKAVLVLLVSVLFFVQCKKKEEVAPADTGEKVRLEIKASWGGEKVGIEDTGLIGVVKWEGGDKIYVGHESGWLGELVASGVSKDGKTALFSGAITTPTGSTKLHLFYLGNNVPVTNSTESVVIDFSDQKTGTLDDIADRFHIAYAETTFDGTGVAQSVIMKNKISIIEFDLSNFIFTDLWASVGEPVYMHGEDLSSELVINCDGTIARKGNKVIQLGLSANKLFGEYIDDHLEGATKYVALIPNDLPVVGGDSQTAKSGRTTLRFDSNHYIAQHVMNNGIIANGFYSTSDEGKASGDPILLKPYDITTRSGSNYGVTPGLFFVDEAKTQMVRFSRQNLSIKWDSDQSSIPTSWSWNYGSNSTYSQYKTISAPNAAIENAVNGWYDMFGYGTTGYNNYSPFNYLNNPKLYCQSDLLQSTPSGIGPDGPSDWGSVAGKANNDSIIRCDGWRTLSATEWEDLFKVHGIESNSKEVIVSWVRDVNNGIFTWVHTYGRAFVPLGFEAMVTTGAILDGYVLKSGGLSEDMKALCQRGLLYLPYAGYRSYNNGVQMNLYHSENTSNSGEHPGIDIPGISYEGEVGATKYWTSTFASGTEAKAFSVKNGQASNVSITTGLAVRLVRNIENFHNDELSLTPTFSN